ncbi:MAG: aminomethyl transferase family protein [Planctomycetes bacterium]|nr:aminomethyl transferase family protein [Planctomycetota bacterium]
MSAGLPLDGAHRAEGASFVEDLGHELPASYGDPEREQLFARDAACVCDRSYRGVLDLSGKDLARVMNGIFSSAVLNLAPGEGQPSALLTAKGKVVAAFQLHMLAPAALRLVFHEPLRPTVVQAIQRYAFLSDIAVTDRSGEVGVLSVEGPAAGRCVALAAAEGGGEIPGRRLASREAVVAGVPATLVRAGESPEGGFELWAPRGALEPVWRALVGGARSLGGGPAGHEAAEALRVEAGLARAGRDYDEESLPNDAGFEGALTYDKCYVGQEVVARVRTYGQANRRLLGVRLPGLEVPPAPAVLRVGGEEAGRATTFVRSARLGTAIGLAMVKRRFWDAPSGLLETPRGDVEASLQGLPFVRVDVP